MPKPTVDHDLCIGCGLCVGSHGDIFAFADDGKADAIAEGEPEDIEDAIASCPVQAIAE